MGRKRIPLRNASTICTAGTRFLGLGTDASVPAELLDRVIPGFLTSDWSLDGTRLAGAFTDTKSGRFQPAMYILATGEDRSAETSEGGPHFGAGVWMHDGRRMLFDDFTSDQMLLWDTDSGEVRVVEGIEDLDGFSLNLSPDGETLIGLREQEQSDSWLLTQEP